MEGRNGNNLGLNFCVELFETYQVGLYFLNTLLDHSKDPNCVDYWADYILYANIDSQNTKLTTPIATETTLPQESPTHWADKPPVSI